MLEIVVYLVLSYLCGAIPFGYIIAKLFKNIDIRTIGSGNTGATNVYRSVSKPLGILTLILDLLKGFLPVYCVMFLNPDFQWMTISVAFVTIIGHTFTIFLKFKGGKGVATACGAFLAINPLAVLVCFIVFVIFFCLIFDSCNNWFKNVLSANVTLELLIRTTAFKLRIIVVISSLIPSSV